MTHRRARIRAGFTLLEMSVVLVIIATIVGAGITVATNKLAQEQEKITEQRMAAIQKALLDYRRVFDSIPCPAALTDGLIEAAFGRGTTMQSSGSACDTTYPPTFSAGSYTWIGAVPVRTLKLPDDYMVDGWGRRFSYVVDERATGLRAFQLMSGIADKTGEISILDINGGTIEANALYALISHGPNGHGAYSRLGSSRISSASENALELGNCGCDSSAANTGFSKNFTMGPYVDNDTNTYVDYFDDIVVFGTRRSLYQLWE